MISVLTGSVSLGEHRVPVVLTKRGQVVKMEDEHQLVFDAWRNEWVSIQKMRCYLFTFVPSTASVKDIKPWLISQGLRFSPEVFSVMCHLHLEDNVLRSWRVKEEGNLSLID